MEGKVQKVQGKKMTVQIFIQAAWHAGQWTTYEENAELKYRERNEEKTLTLIKLGANRRRGRS